MRDRAPSSAAGPVRSLSIAAGVGVALSVLSLVALKSLRDHSDWPTSRSDNLLLTAVFTVGALPILIVLLGVVITSRGIIRTKLFELDMSGAPERGALGVAVPPNIGVGAQPIGDSGSQSILDGLERATTGTVAFVDLGAGTAWWETRLFILAAGAERLGRPDILVFLADAPVREAFVGWAKPRTITAALMAVGRPRSEVYRVSHGQAIIAAEAWKKTLSSAPLPGVVPVPAPEVVAMGFPWNANWIAVLANGTFNPFSAEQFLAADLGRTLEARWTDPVTQPDRAEPVTVTAGSIRELLGTDLVTSSIPDGATSAELLAAFSSSTADWFSVTAGESFVRMLPASVLEAAVVRAIARTYE